LQPDILFAQSTTAVTAISRATRTIPIVFVQVTDPVRQGFVVSFARPGGAITGFSNFEPTIGGKWLQQLREIVPQLAHVAVLFHPETAPYFGLYLRSLGLGAPTLSVRVTPAPVRQVSDIEAAMSLIGREQNSGLILPPDVFTSNHRKLINSLAIHYRLPTICSFRYVVTDGGLVSYGPDVDALYRRAISYVDRILRGERPAELPVQQSTKFELVINLKTAKALGLTIPPSLLARADMVIE
jgi:putative ABC transport system substrate-binding protein